MKILLILAVIGLATSLFAGRFIAVGMGTEEDPNEE